MAHIKSNHHDLSAIYKEPEEFDTPLTGPVKLGLTATAFLRNLGNARKLYAPAEVLSAHFNGP